MQQRSPAAVFFLSLITLGIYALVWHVKTKNELNRLGATIPTAWLLIVPLANLYWIWKYAEGVEQVSGGKISAVLALILMLLLSIVGYAILQGEFNKLGLQPAAAGTAPIPGAPGSPPVVDAAPVIPAQPLGAPEPSNSMPPAPGIGAPAPGLSGPTSFSPDKPSEPTDTPPSPPAPLVQ
jgi:hypothetical protein